MAEKAAYILKRVTLASLYISIYLFAQVFLSIPLPGLSPNVDSAVGITMVLSMVMSWLIYKVMFYLRDVPYESGYAMSRPTFLDALFAAALAIGFRVVTSVYFLWAENVNVLSNSIDNAPSYEVESMTVFGFFSLIFAMYIAAPIFEEILFRGLVMSELEKIMPSWAAAILQGIVFGVFHLILVQGIFAAVLGTVLGFVYERTRKLSVTIAIHMMFNISGVMELRDDVYAPFAAVVGCAVVAAAMGMFMFLYRKKDSPAV